MITCIMPRIIAASVPGRMGIHWSALVEVREKRGSMETTRAPFSMASNMKWMSLWAVSAMFLPNRMMSLLPTMSGHSFDS